MKRTVSIVVPVYQNEANLQETVPKLLSLAARLPGYRLELVFVDDGSRDRSLVILADYAKRHPEAMPQAMNTLVRLMLQTIFEEGLFHADPHPGNVFVLPDGRLSLLDFGNTGELDEAMRDSLTLLLEAVVNGDARAATEAYLEMAPAGEDINRAALLVDIKTVLYEIRRTSLDHVSVGNALEALLRAGSRNGVHNPAEFVLLTMK